MPRQDKEHLTDWVLAEVNLAPVLGSDRPRLLLQIINLKVVFELYGTVIVFLPLRARPSPATIDLERVRVRIVANDSCANLTRDVLEGAASDEVLVIVVGEVVPRVHFTDFVKVRRWMRARWSGADPCDQLPLGRSEAARFVLVTDEGTSVVNTPPLLLCVPQSHLLRQSGFV